MNNKRTRLNKKNLIIVLVVVVIFIIAFEVVNSALLKTDEPETMIDYSLGILYVLLSLISIIAIIVVINIFLKNPKKIINIFKIEEFIEDEKEEKEG